MPNYRMAIRKVGDKNKWVIEKYQGDKFVQHFPIVTSEENDKKESKDIAACFDNSQNERIKIFICGEDNKANFLYWDQTTNPPGFRLNNVKLKKKILKQDYVSVPDNVKTYLDGSFVYLGGQAFKIYFMRANAEAMKETKNRTSVKSINLDEVLVDPDPTLVSEVKQVSDSSQLPEKKHVQKRAPVTVQYKYTSRAEFEGSTYTRFIHSIVGFPKRSIAGGVSAVIFLALVFSPALIPSAFFASIALWMQQFLFPFAMAKGLSLVAAKNTVALVGGFLAFTAPKWVGNLCQFVGKRILAGFFERLFVGLAFYPIELCKWVAKYIPNDAKTLFGELGNLFVHALLLPAHISHIVGEYLLNKPATYLAGEENPAKEDSKPFSTTHANISRIKTPGHKNLATEYPAIEFADREPAILFPKERYDLTLTYGKFFNEVHKLFPVPNLEEYSEEHLPKKQTYERL